MKIVIADDSELICERITTYLSEFSGVEIVGVAHSGWNTVSLVRETQPDVVILDIRMPDGNGVSVLKEIKKIRPETCVMMFTNYPFLQYRKRCLDLGADYFFFKSTEFEKMIDQVRFILNQGANSLLN